jgi:hypothetical protein
MATVIANTGKAIYNNRLRGTGTEPVFAAWGTGAGTAAIADTTLFTENGSRVSGTSSVATTTTTNDTYRVVSTLTAGGALTITNAGLFDASSAGNLFLKGDFTGVALATGESIQFTFNAVLS